MAKRARRKSMFLVIGHTGEHADYGTWPVAVLATLAEADAFAAQCTAEAGVILAAAGWKKRGDQFPDSAACRAHPHDPGMQADYTGTVYSVVRVPREIMPIIEAGGW